MTKKGIFTKAKLTLDQNGLNISVKEGRYGWTTSTVNKREDKIQRLAQLISNSDIEKELLSVLRALKKKKSKKA